MTGMPRRISCGRMTCSGRRQRTTAALARAHATSATRATAGVAAPSSSSAASPRDAPATRGNDRPRARKNDFTRNGEPYDVVFDAVAQTCVSPLPATGCGRRYEHHDRPRVHVAPRGVRPRPETSEPRDRPRREAERPGARGAAPGGYVPSGDRPPVSARTVVETHRYAETQQKTGSVMLTVVEVAYAALPVARASRYDCTKPSSAPSRTPCVLPTS